MPSYRKRTEAKRGPAVKNPEDLERTVKIRLTPVEFDHVLAGLRLVEDLVDRRALPSRIEGIATDKGELLAPEDIDALCQDLNLGGRDVR